MKIFFPVLRGVCPINIHIDRDKNVSDIIGRQTLMLSLDVSTLNFSLTYAEDDDGNACGRTREKKEKSGEGGGKRRKRPSLVIYQML